MRSVYLRGVIAGVVIGGVYFNWVGGVVISVEKSKSE